jgi:hypothetical protein
MQLPVKPAPLTSPADPISSWAGPFGLGASAPVRGLYDHGYTAYNDVALRSHALDAMGATRDIIREPMRLLEQPLDASLSPSPIASIDRLA